jgi:Uma2 family endonuclease
MEPSIDLPVALPTGAMPLTIRFGVNGKTADELFLRFCRANPDLRCERTADGDVIVAPPSGGESSSRNLDVAAALGLWSRRDRQGEAFDSAVMYMLADGSSLSPDASWVSHKALRRLSREERKTFLRLCPEFVVEVMSPSDRLGAAKKKMEQWIANGCKLGWLVDGDQKRVYVYRPGHPVEVLDGILKIQGEGPVKGFVLPLRRIWAGLA